MRNKKILFILAILFVPTQVHADTQEHRACIAKAVTERKEALTKAKELKNIYLRDIRSSPDFKSQKKSVHDKYKKIKTDIWYTFIKNKNLCVKS